MELKDYLSPLLKWWWLIVAATLVAAGSSYLATRQQPPIYQSQTTLIAGRTIDDPNPTTGQLVLGQQLAETYADIVNREQVRRATMEALGLERLPQFTATTIPNTQLIELRVFDTSPQRAQAVANELATQLILLSPTSSTEDQERLIFINEQLDDLEVQINETSDEIVRLQNELGELTSASDIESTQNQIVALQNKLATLQTNYATLLSNTQQGALNTLTIIEPANLPNAPVGPNIVTSVLLASTIGLILSSLAAYLLEYFDDTLRSPDEINRVLNAPVIGLISEIQNSDTKWAYVAENPRSMVAEAFRTLRTNLEFVDPKKPTKSLLVSSPRSGEGKTSVATNLAIVIAQTGKKVILVDADLRRPSIHRTLELPNKAGLSNLLQDDLNIHDVIQTWKDDKVAVVTGGTVLTNPNELLNSTKLDHILRSLSRMADVVILDGPPLFIAESALLASKVDGVLLILRPGYTSTKVAKNILEQMQRTGARILGVALNRVPMRRATYYGGYWYYSPYYADDRHYFTEGDGDTAESQGVSRRRGATPAFLKRLFQFSPRQRARKGYPNVLVTTRNQGQSLAATHPLSAKPGLAGNNARYTKSIAWLEWDDTNGKSRKFHLHDGDTVLIGRDKINDLALTSRHVSRRHAVVTCRNQAVEIADLGSTNGTAVNGKKIDRPHRLQKGDIIRLFDVELTFHPDEPKSDTGSESQSG